MKKLILFLCILLPGITFAGDKPLTKELVSALQGAMGTLENLQNRYPGLKEEELNANLFDTKAQLALIDAAGATGEVERVVKAAGFDDIESFLGYAQRMMSSMFAVMKEQMPADMNMDALIKQQESALSAMKASGLPEATMKEIKKGIADMKAQASIMEKATAYAKSEDISFMRQNLPWVMQKFESSMGAN